MRPAVFASSVGTEDMVVLDLLVGARLQIRTFKLDEATHDTIAAAIVVA